MAMNFSEMSGIKQWGMVVLGGAVVTAALYFTLFKSPERQEHGRTTCPRRQDSGKQRA